MADCPAHHVEAGGQRSIVPLPEESHVVTFCSQICHVNCSVRKNAPFRFSCIAFQPMAALTCVGSAPSGTPQASSCGPKRRRSRLAGTLSGAELWLRCCKEGGRRYVGVNDGETLGGVVAQLRLDACPPASSADVMSQLQPARQSRLRSACQPFDLQRITDCHPPPLILLPTAAAIIISLPSVPLATRSGGPTWIPFLLWAA